MIDEQKSLFGYNPSLPTQEITVGLVIRRSLESGKSDFIPGFNNRFPKIISSVRDLEASTLAHADSMIISDILPEKTILTNK